VLSAVRAELPAIEPAGRGEGLPLSLVQQRLWSLATALFERETGERWVGYRHLTPTFLTRS